MIGEHVFFGEDGEPTPQWWNVVARFRQQARRFWEQYERLKNIDVSGLPQNLRDEYYRLISRFEKTRETVENVTNSIDTFIGWFKGWFGMEGTSSLRELGALPLVPVAVIGGAIAVMSKIVTDTVEFYKKVDIYEQAVAQGATPGQAADAVSRVQGGFFANVGNLAPVLIAGVLFVFVLPRITGGK